MSIRILTDSAADFTPEERRAYGVEAPVQLQVLFGAQSYLYGETITRDEYWARMIDGEIATTSQPATDDFVQVFERAKAAGDELIYIGLSSALSGTVQGACIARDMVEYDGIFIVDSLSVTIGQKLLTLAACRLRDEGKTAAQIVDALHALRSRVRIYANVDTLSYLARGGRLSRTAANIGTLAQLKPMVFVNDEGGVAVAGKSIGRHRAIDALAKKVASFPIDTAYPVIPVYSYDPTNMHAFLVKLETVGVSPACELTTDLGAVISAHVGPNAYGVAFIENA